MTLCLCSYVREFVSCCLYLCLNSLVVAGPLLAIVLLTESLLKKEVMGGGDIKLFFVTGLYLDYDMTFICLAVTCFLALDSALIAEARVKKTENRGEKAMAPFITISVVMVHVWQMMV